MKLQLCESIKMKALIRGFLSLFLLLYLSRQTDAQLKFDYGPKVGPNVSLLRGDRPYNGMRKPVYGFCAGGFFNVRGKKPWFQFEMDMLFTTRGNRADYLNTNSGENEAKKINVTYLEFPLLFKFVLVPGKQSRISFFGGPAYAGILRANFKGKTIEERITNDIKRDDLGIVAGSGFSWFYLDRWYFLDIRYYHGMINTSDLITKNLDVFNPNLDDLAIEQDPLKNEIGKYFNSTLSITFGVSLSRQIIRFQ